jgi:hypothetical protein
MDALLSIASNKASIARGESSFCIRSLSFFGLLVCSTSLDIKRTPSSSTEETVSRVSDSKNSLASRENGEKPLHPAHVAGKSRGGQRFSEIDSNL